MALAMLGAILLIYNTIDSERSEREQVELTTEVLTELRNVSRAAINAETGQRGYLITLDRRYLDPYRTGRELFRPSLDRLRAGRVVEAAGTWLSGARPSLGGTSASVGRLLSGASLSGGFE